MKKLFLGLAALLTAGVVFFVWVGGTTGLMARALPDFPELPAPAARLGADAAGVLHFTSSTPYDLDVILGGMQHAIPTTGEGTLYLPPGASADAPVPALVLLHGSGGLSPGREHPMGRWLAEQGTAGFVVDYYTPRGMGDETNYMLRVVAVTEFDAVADAYGALRLLSAHPAIDPTRIGVMGFSYGGMAVRIAMDERVRLALAPELPGFSAFVDVYGPCFQDLDTPATNGAPLLTLRGTEDASNDLAACREREDELRGLGVAVEAEVYEGAGHAWEVDLPRELMKDAPYVTGCTVRYDERGRSFVGDRALVDVTVETPRAERVVMRLASGDVMLDCVKRGYLIGRDDATRARAEARILAFLERVWPRG
ncbi:MAG: dienelactone hydrolase family protein [Myxococcota bacterium]|nr:dienelactone hydrolase family protein [Myxococcota bacterium]